MFNGKNLPKYCKKFNNKKVFKLITTGYKIEALHFGKMRVNALKFFGKMRKIKYFCFGKMQTLC